MALVDEYVLHRQLGGPEVMREQLEHLLKMMVYPQVFVQVVPLSSRMSYGLKGGFVLAELPSGAHWAYIDNATAGVVTDRAEDLEDARALLEVLRAWALPHPQSETLIRKVLDSYDPH